LESRQFQCLKSVLAHLTKKDDEYVFIRHTLKAGKRVRAHYHPRAHETLIIFKGNFAVRFGQKAGPLEKQEFYFDITDSGKIQVISFKPGEVHAFIARTKVSYFVLRDRKDKTVYVKK
jgi:quercetin dioxygenase-like cupin family protein